MRVLLSRFRFCALLIGFLSQAALVTHAQEAAPPWCSFEQLDLNLGPQGASPSSNAHWLTIEIRNRGAADCKLQPLSVGFPPDDTQINDIFDNAGFKDSSQAAATFLARSRRLGPGEEVHVVIAWISVPFEVRGMTLDDCRGHDELTVFPSGPNNSKPLLDVRNLRMWSCDNTFWRSSYRLGPFATPAPVSKGWLERVHLNESDFTVSDQGVQEQRVTRDSGVKLWALSDVQYLKGSPDSGYFGLFGLFLRFSAPGFQTCPFRSLRKREADGRATLFLNHCEDNPGQKRVSGAMKEVSLSTWVFGLLPEKVGKVEYDVVSEIVQNGKIELVTSHLDLSVRDPNEPTLPTIDSSASDCQQSQLHLTNPVVQLGAHWKRPLESPTAVEDWYDGKVFEVTNISSQSCLLGGMPDLKFSNFQGVISKIGTPVCRNCETPLFKPREVRWIEMQPNDSAHFFVVRDISQSGSYGCSTTREIDMAFSGGQPMHPPFEASYCRLFVSAWRSGKYNGDPMNLQYDSQEAKQEQQWIGTFHSGSSKVVCIDYSEPASALPPPGPQCEQEEFAKNGRPAMSPAIRGVAFGVSSPPGKPTIVHVWLDNQTDSPQSYYMCCGSTFLDAIDVYDSGGHRLLTKSEQVLRKTCTAGQEFVRSCTCSAVFSIAPHTLQVVESGSIENGYRLPPGRYFVVPAVVHREDCESLRRSPTQTASAQPANAIMVVIPE